MFTHCEHIFTQLSHTAGRCLSFHFNELLLVPVTFGIVNSQLMDDFARHLVGVLRLWLPAVSSASTYLQWCSSQEDLFSLIDATSNVGRDDLALLLLRVGNHREPNGSD